MRTNRMLWLTTIMFSALAFVGIAAGQGQRGGGAPSKFMLTSPEIPDGSAIPTQFTCADSAAATPELQWSAPPAAAMSFALIMHDLDGAPMKGTMDITHWIVWGISGSSTSLPAGIKPDSSPDGIMQGKNVRNVNGYQPPCPPPGGAAHDYVLELYALDAKLDLPAGSSRADLLKAMDGHVVGKASLTAHFGR